MLLNKFKGKTNALIDNNFLRIVGFKKLLFSNLTEIGFYNPDK